MSRQRTFLAGVLLLILSGCSRNELELSLSEINEWTYFNISNLTDSPLMVSNGLYGRVKRSDGDLYPVVRDGESRVVRPCAIIDSHERAVYEPLEGGRSIKLREWTEFLRGLYCLDSSGSYKLTVEYRIEKAGAFVVVHSSNEIQLPESWAARPKADGPR